MRLRPASRARRSLGGDDPTQVVDVGHCFEADIPANDAAAQIGKVLSLKTDHVAACNGAAIGEVLGEIDIDIASRQQGAATIQIARLQTNVNLGHQSLNLAAIRQRHGLFHQPDNIAGQLCHLGICQRHSGDELVGLGKNGPLLKQGTVLGFIVGIAIQETPPRQLGNLLPNQFLLVKAVSQALLGRGGVDAQLLQHVVGT